MITPIYGKQLDSTYPSKLKEIKISLLEDFKGAKKHHSLKCDICGHEWSATPISKIQNFKRHQIKGCPECCRGVKHNAARIQNLQNLKERNITYLGDITLLSQTTKRLPFKNNNCGHTFDTFPGNVLYRGVDCPICGIETRKAQLTQTSKDRSEIYQLTASEWNIYRHIVYALTRQSYKNHTTTINPLNLKRGKAGVDGAHHLDHIVPVRYCFNNNVPTEICAHYENLQMLNWRANVGSRDKLKPNLPIPQILQELFNNS